MKSAADFYKKGCDKTVGDVTRLDALSQALRLWKEQIREGQDPESWCSLQKNIGSAHLQRARLVEGQIAWVWEFSEALRCWAAAWRVKPQTEWSQALEKRAEEVSLECFTKLCIVSDDYNARVSTLATLRKNAAPQAGDMPRVCFVLSYLRAEQFFKVAVRLQDQASKSVIHLNSLDDRRLDLIASRNNLCLAEEDLRQADSSFKAWEQIRGDEIALLGGDGSLTKTDLEDLVERCQIHKCIADASLALLAGEASLRAAMQDVEELDVEQLWVAFDFFKEAGLLLREKDLLLEAFTCSKMGQILRSVWKDDKRSHDYYVRSLQLADISGSHCGTHEWYRVARDALTQDQQAKQRKEEMDKQHEDEPYKIALHAELETLKEKLRTESHEGFLKFIYETHKPKKFPDYKFEVVARKETDEYNSEMKRLLLKSLLHYHPDKQAGEDRKWCVLCGEITKILTNKYETFK